EKNAVIDEYIKTSRKVVERFLNKNFSYNPDRHVRAAHTDNPTDPERTPKDELIRQRCALAKRAPRIEQRMQENMERVYGATRDLTLATYQHTKAAIGAIETAIKALGNCAGAGSADDAIVILNRSKQKLDGIARDLSRAAEPLSAADT